MSNLHLSFEQSHIVSDAIAYNVHSSDAEASVLLEVHSSISNQLAKFINGYNLRSKVKISVRKDIRPYICDDLANVKDIIGKVLLSTPDPRHSSLGFRVLSEVDPAKGLFIL